MPRSTKHKQAVAEMSSVFVSHSSANTQTAVFLAKKLKQLFPHVNFFVASQDIATGASWLEELKEKLSAAELLIAIVTNDYRHSSWCQFEVGAAWFANKKCLLLLSPELKPADLPQPLNLLHAQSLANLYEVEKFLESLAHYVGGDAHAAKLHAMDIKEVVLTQLGREASQSNDGLFGKFKTSLADLPSSDSDKKQIALWCLERNDATTFERILLEIADESTKAEIGLSCILNKKWRALPAIASSINAADRLGRLYMDTVEHGHLEVELLLMIADRMANRNQAELRKVACFLIERELESSVHFAKIIDLFTNMAELRNVGRFFLLLPDQRFAGNASLSKVIDSVLSRNAAEGRNLLCSFVEKGFGDARELVTKASLLLSKNPSEFRKFLIFMIETGHSNHPHFAEWCVQLAANSPSQMQLVQAVIDKTQA